MAAVHRISDDDWEVSMGDDDCVRIEVRMCRDTARSLCEQETRRLQELNPDRANLEASLGVSVMHVLGMYAALGRAG